MDRGALRDDEYYRGQAVEVRNTHYGRERWRAAKIHRRTSRGYEVVYNDGSDQRPQHVLFSDLRPTQPTERERPQVTTKALTAEDIERLNAQLEAKAEEPKDPPPPPPPQTLVLLKRPERPPAEMETRMFRKPRMTKVHNPTRLSLLLRNTRSEKQIRQGDLAGALKMSQSRLSAIEAADTLPTDKELDDFAVALELDSAHLRELRDTPEPPPVDPEAERALRRELEDFRQHAPALRSAIEQLRAENLRLKTDNVRLQGKAEREAARVAPPAAGDLEQLREENAVLRAAVVFYAGMER